MRHAKHCPRRVGTKSPCTCGGMNPVPPGLTVDGPIDLSHSGLCLAAMGATGPCTCGTPPKVTDDNPYRDVERSRDLAARAEAAALEGKDDLARFLLQLAGEARLLAELQGRWEY